MTAAMSTTMRLTTNKIEFNLFTIIKMIDLSSFVRGKVEESNKKALKKYAKMIEVVESNQHYAEFI